MDKPTDKTPADFARLSKAMAMDQVEEAANEAWKELMYDIIWALGCEMEFLTTDDVCIRYRELPEEGRPDTHEWKALGPVMRNAAKLGYIERTDYFRKSTDGARRHHAPLQIWRSLIFGGKKHAHEG